MNPRRIFKSAVAWGVATMAIRGLALVTTLPLIVKTVPRELYGAWFVFLNIAALVPAFDFGFGPTIGRVTAQILARRENPAAGGDGATALFFDETLADFLGTVRALYRWLQVSAFVLLSVGGGAWIWWITRESPERATIWGAWLLYCPTFALTLSIGFWRPYLYGLNAVTPSQIVQAIAQAAQLLALFLGLLKGWNLYALAGSNLLMCVVLLIGLRRWAARDPVGREYRAAPARIDPRIFGKLWKTSWRTFVNILGLYLIVNVTGVIGSKFLGPEGIAAYGLSFQLIILCTQVSGLWIEVKTPLFPRLYLSDRPALHALLISRMRLVLLTAITSVCGIALLWKPLLPLLHARSGLTILPTLPFFLLALYFVLQLHHYEFELISLGFNYNPFSLPVLLTGIANGVLLVVLTPRLHVWALILCPLAVQAACNNWWTVGRSLRLLGLSPGAYLAGVFLGKTPNVAPVP